MGNVQRIVKKHQMNFASISFIFKSNVQNFPSRLFACWQIMIIKSSQTSCDYPKKGMTMTYDGPKLPDKIADEDINRDILIVASKLKKYISAKSGLNTSQSVIKVLSDFVRSHCDDAIQNATRAERKTVLDRDFVKRF
jgi:hypothetical protein